jgi:hypothetical protein
MRSQITMAFTAVMMALMLFSFCGQHKDRNSSTRVDMTIDTSFSSVPYDSVVIELIGIDSQTVFDLLKSSHQVEYKSSALGVFVTAIDSIENSSGICWVYSVNDSLPKVASDKYITKNGDVVKWHFRKSTR